MNTIRAVTPILARIGKLAGLLFLAALAVLLCTGCADKIVIDWNNMTYEQIRSFEDVVLATHGNQQVTLSDLVCAIDRYELPFFDGRMSSDTIEDGLDEALVRVSVRVLADDSGWDGTLNDMAREVARQGTARVEKELAGLSSDPAEALRMYADKHRVDAGYVIRRMQMDIGAYYFLVFDQPPIDGTLESLRSTHAEHEAKGEILAAVSQSLKTFGIDAEDLLKYLQEGNMIFTYEPSFKYEAGVSIIRAEYISSEDEEAYEWLKSAETGDFRHFPEVDMILQACTASDEILTAKYNMGMVMRWALVTDLEIYRNEWKIDKKMIRRIEIIGTSAE
jgi:hypothetical protein